MSTLEQEVRTLQKQVRRQRRWNIALGGLVLVGGLMAATAAKSVPDVIQAKTFEVVNDAGVAVVTLRSCKWDGVILKCDNKGNVTFIVVNEKGEGGMGEGTVITQNGKGGMLVRLGVTTDGEGGVVTENGKGQKLVELGATSGGGSVTTENGKGGRLVELGVTPGGGSVTTGNGKGGRLVRLGVTTNGEGVVKTQNGKGGTLVELGATTDGEGLVVTENGKGQTLVELGVYNGLNGGYVETFTQTGVSTSENP